MRSWVKNLQRAAPGTPPLVIASLVLWIPEKWPDSHILIFRMASWLGNHSHHYGAFRKDHHRAIWISASRHLWSSPLIQSKDFAGQTLTSRRPLPQEVPSFSFLLFTLICCSSLVIIRYQENPRKKLANVTNCLSFKTCLQIFWHSSHQEVRPMSPPNESMPTSATHSQLKGRSGNDSMSHPRLAQKRLYSFCSCTAHPVTT